MANVLYGGGVLDARGSVGGTTMSRSKFGPSHRAKTSPIQPYAFLQRASRALLANISALWSTLLTPTDRAAWNAFALTAPVTNPFGQTSYLSGHQWFVRANVTAYHSGGATVTAVPPSTSYPALTTLSITSSHVPGNELVLTFTNPALPGTPVLYIFATPNLSPGLSSYLSKFRFLQAVNTPVSPFNASSMYMARFLQVGPVAGKQIGVIAYLADAGSGLISAPFAASTIVT